MPDSDDPRSAPSGALPDSVLCCRPDKVVVRLNRAPFRRRPGDVLLLIGSLLALLLLGLLLAFPSHLTRLEVGLIWTLGMIVVFRNLFFDRTLVAAAPPGSAQLETASVLGGPLSRKELCAPGRARALTVRSKADFDSEPRPYELHELVAETASGRVFLCSFEDRDAALEVGQTLAQVLGCRWDA